MGIGQYCDNFLQACGNTACELFLVWQRPALEPRSQIAQAGARVWLASREIEFKNICQLVKKKCQIELGVLVTSHLTSGAGARVLLTGGGAQAGNPLPCTFYKNRREIKIKIYVFFSPLIQPILKLHKIYKQRTRYGDF